MIYHAPGQRDYNKISINNVVWFNSEDETVAAGIGRHRGKVQKYVKGEYNE